MRGATRDNTLIRESESEVPPNKATCGPTEERRMGKVGVGGFADKTGQTV